MCNSDKNKKIIIYKNKYVCLPEFIIEYTYTLQNYNLHNSPTDHFIVSPYTSKLDFKFDPFEVLNNGLKMIAESHINKYIDFNFVDNYKNLKLFSLEELSTTSSLFFAKATIVKFMQKCFKYSNIEDFTSEFSKINDKIEEINSLNFSQTIVKDIGENKENFEKLVCINLFNCQLQDKDLSILLDKLFMIEEVSISNNFLESFNFKDVNNTLKKIDLSHNRIKSLTNFYPDTFRLLEYVDVDFNFIFSIDEIINFFDVHSLKQFFFFFNPISKAILGKIKSSILKNDNDKYDINHIKKLLFSEDDTLDNEEAIINLNNMENDLIKNVDIIYDSYSFTDRYSKYTKSSIFKEKCNFKI